MANIEKQIEQLASRSRKSTFMESAEQLAKEEVWKSHSVNIALTVLEALEAKRWTQRQLAEKMEVSPQRVNTLLKGRENLTLETIAKLETILGVSILHILAFEETEKDERDLKSA